MKRLISLGIALSLAIGSMSIAITSADARPGVKRHGSGAVHHRRNVRRGDAAAGAAVAGIAGALIGGAIVAHERRRDRDGFYDYPRYGYGPPPYGYYGY